MAIPYEIPTHHEPPPQYEDCIVLECGDIGNLDVDVVYTYDKDQTDNNGIELVAVGCAFRWWDHNGRRCQLDIGLWLESHYKPMLIDKIEDVVRGRK